MIDDFDKAYSNVDAIDNAADYPALWSSLASEFRTHMISADQAKLDIAYGAHPRQSYDVFWPETPARGLFVFVHGGYWRRFDKSYWSHLAAGAMRKSYAAAMINYRLAPDVSLAEIYSDCMASISHASTGVDGPIVLAGHSAGGQIVTRAICDQNMPHALSARLARIVSISGVHDLRPLIKTTMNVELNIDERLAACESPVLLTPVVHVPITFAVGEKELPEFHRQNDVVASLWTGLGLEVENLHIAGKHHFDVIDGLREADSELLARL